MIRSSAEQLVECGRIFRLLLAAPRAPPRVRRACGSWVRCCSAHCSASWHWWWRGRTPRRARRRSGPPFAASLGERVSLIASFRAGVGGERVCGILCSRGNRVLRAGRSRSPRTSRKSGGVARSLAAGSCEGRSELCGHECGEAGLAHRGTGGLLRRGRVRDVPLPTLSYARSSTKTSAGEGCSR